MLTYSGIYMYNNISTIRINVCAHFNGDFNEFEVWLNISSPCVMRCTFIYELLGFAVIMDEGHKNLWNQVN